MDSKEIRVFHNDDQAYDMGRTENGTSVSDAGLRLLRDIRGSGSTIPVLFYTSPFAESEYRSEVIEAGATVITSSPTILFEQLQALRLL